MQVPPESAGTDVNIRSVRIVVAPVLIKMHFLFGNDCCALRGEALIAGVFSIPPRQMQFGLPRFVPGLKIRASEANSLRRISGKRAGAIPHVGITIDRAPRMPLASRARSSWLEVAWR